MLDYMRTPTILDIIYQDDHIVVVDKPQGMLVHRSKMAQDADTFLLQELRNQIGRRVNAVHRLDRKTSGLILFAFEGDITKQLQDQFLSKTVEKLYLAIVRGYFAGPLLLDYDLTDDRGRVQDAVTHFDLIEQVEVDVPFGGHPTSRYSMISAMPETGRLHQIRKHLAHLRHPIIGDRPHGCNKQNKLFKERWAMTNMLLHAYRLSFDHPVDHRRLELRTPPPPVFQETSAMLGFNQQPWIL